MTQKELLYFEDAYNHEKNIINLINSYLSILKEKRLVSFMEKEIKKHEQIMDKLLKKMEDKANE